MSHFSVGVILSRNLSGEEIDSAIECALEPFDENTEVPGYKEKCHCFGWAAKAASYEYAGKVVGDIQDINRRLNGSWFPQTEAIQDPEERAVLEGLKKEWLETVDNYQQAHPNRTTFDPNCEDCNGTGVRISTYNPQSKWDWWRVGGRWDGCLVENPQESENGFNFSKIHETLQNNSCPVQELLDREVNGGELFTFFAVITPDGEWIERGKMGWWAMVSNEKEQNSWADELREIYRRYADYDIVLLDAHI